MRAGIIQAVKKIKFVFASDSFKGSLSNEEINKILTNSAHSVFGECECVSLPVADGGEGTLRSLTRIYGGEIRHLEVSGPLFEKAEAAYGVAGDTAIISMNEASGLTLLSDNERNPFFTTTYGTGELILNALKSGYGKIIVTLGGSATDDGGTGALTALGYRFIKKDGSTAKGTGGELKDIVDIDFSGAADFKNVEVTVLCDVVNRFTGENGATYVFGRQKGADDKTLDILEEGMKNLADVIRRKTGADVNTVVGGGAAGGLGGALSVFLGGKMKSGIDAVLDAVDFDNKIRGAACIITGEGRLDFQSADGKVVSGVAERAKKQGVPVIAICGSFGEGAEKIFKTGVTSAFSLIDKPADLKDILLRSSDLYRQTADNVFRIIKAFSFADKNNCR